MSLDPRRLVPGPQRPATTWRPLRALAYLLVRTPLPAVAAAAVYVAAARDGETLVLVGVPVLVSYVVIAVASAGAERRAVGILGRPAVPDPHRTGVSGGIVARLRGRLAEPATARELLYALVNLPLACLDVAVLTAWALAPVLLAAPFLVGAEPLAVGPFTVTTVPQAWATAAAGLVLLFGCGPAVMAVAILHAGLARSLLGPRGEEFRQQVLDLTRSRIRLTDAFDAERRRIERDLHDGAQQQLVALAMVLDLARIELEGTAHHAAAGLVDRAHAQAVDTLRQLRDLIEGIHPPALAERGLAGALRALADRSAVPVDVRVDLPGRLERSVESAAYFVAAEALTNVAKHSGATQVRILVDMDDGTLTLDVVDDGAGGADPGRGTGLTGLGDRLSVVGGRLTVSSPPGGPTRIRARIPRAQAGQPE